MIEANQTQDQNTMRTQITILLSFLPLVAVAHPDHGSSVFSIIHYFTGSHLALGIGAGVLVGVALRAVWQRFVR